MLKASTLLAGQYLTRRVITPDGEINALTIVKVEKDGQTSIRPFTKEEPGTIQLDSPLHL